MKKRLIVILIIVLAGVCFSGCTAAKSNENGEIIEATEAEVFFNEKVLPLVLQYGAVAAGVLSVLLPILSKVNKSRRTFDAANAGLEAVKEMSMNVNDKVAKKDSEILMLKREIDEIKQSTEKLLKVCKIAFVNNKDLVINGFAGEIKEVMENAEIAKEKSER